MRVTATLTGTEAVRSKLQAIGRQTGLRALAATAEDAQDYIEGEAAKHNRSGALVRSVYLRRLSQDAFEVGHDEQVAKHARYVIFGSKAHEIRAKNKQALHYARNGIFWYWFGPKPKDEQGRIRAWVRKKSGSNARVMFRWPKHPGYAGDPWLVRAAARAPADFERHVAAHIARITSGA